MSQEPDLIMSCEQADEAAITAFAAALGRSAPDGARLFLEGPLGAGKTTFARAFLRSRNITGAIKSPSFSVVEVYDAVVPALYHFDFYRLNDPRAWLDMGLRSYFETDGIALIEWPGHAADLPGADLSAALDFATQEHLRQLRLTPGSITGQRWLAAANANAPI